jgi:serine/threonine protein kinase
VEIRDIDVTEDGAPFLVMELLVGESLGDRMQRVGKLPVADVLLHAAQTLDVLAAAHEQGIIHRDIKPANLFLQTDGPLKVLDFGLARMHEVSFNDGLFTKEGTTLGTTPYMPPEQARGRAIDARADIFAVGATMFRLLTGRYLHDANGAFDLLMRMGRDPAPPIRSIEPSVPVNLAAVIDRALGFDRELRYPDARAMLEDVRAVSAGRAPTHAVVRPAPEVTVIEPPATTVGPSIDVSFSDMITEAKSTDREPSPEEKPPPTAAPTPASVEHTLRSPGTAADKR